MKKLIDANVHKCLVSILDIGLACSVESPKERKNMEEVDRELNLIKNAFLGFRIRRDVFKIGLACSLELPQERMNMENVTRELHHIKNAFLGIGIYG
ncbi:hypothetical protein CFP56_033023 [Quercus suber]|uniref:Uncharacterized protein n=1 Tax=Quercus suber TaxID=58331 RepID=A0AAW0JF03_QUESU